MTPSLIFKRRSGGKWSEAGAGEQSLRSMFSLLAMKSKQGVQSPPRPQLIVDFKHGWLQTGPVQRLQDNTRGNPLSDTTAKGFVLQERSSLCNRDGRIMPSETPYILSEAGLFKFDLFNAILSFNYRVVLM